MPSNGSDATVRDSDEGPKCRRHDEGLASVEAVLFDLDGTLINSVELILSSFRYATEQVLGAPLPDERLMKNVGVPLARQMQDFSSEHADELIRVYRGYHAELHDRMVDEYAGTEETLVALATGGYRLGVVTSKMRDMAFRGLDRFGLARFFDVVVGLDDVEIHKPHPHPLLAAASALGVPAAACAYVGDSPHDMVAARAAGCVAVAALWGAFPAEELLQAGPDHAIRAPTELLVLLGLSER